MAGLLQYTLSEQQYVQVVMGDVHITHNKGGFKCFKAVAGKFR